MNRDRGKSVFPLSVWRMITTKIEFRVLSISVYSKNYDELMADDTRMKEDVREESILGIFEDGRQK